MSTQTQSDFNFFKYDPIDSDIKVISSKFTQYFEFHKRKGTDYTENRIFSYFYEGMMQILKGDEQFLKKDYKKAKPFYDEGFKFINRARSSRVVEGDIIHDEMVKWLSFAESRIKLLSSFDENDLEKKIELVSQTKESMEKFLALRKEEGKIEKVIANAHYSLVDYYDYLYQSKKVEEESSRLKILLKAYSALIKANYFYRIFDKELEAVKGDIDEIVMNNIIIRAEYYWNKGSLDIVLSDFKAANVAFSMASEYYSRASEICSSLSEQKLYLALSKITLASKKEARANELHRKEDNPLEASKLFVEAQIIVDYALALLISIKSETLIKNMSAQREYYQALSKETMGIFHFDNEELHGALANFEEAHIHFAETEKLAKQINNEQLLEFVRKGKSEVDGYIAMTNAMF